MNRESKIIKLTDLDSDHLAKVMSRAFQHQPNFTYIFPNDENRFGLLKFFYSFVLQIGLQFGKVYTTETQDGAAIWISSEKKMAFSGLIKAGMLKMPFIFGWRSFRKSMMLNSELEKTRKQVMPKCHWYLMALGVDTIHQGKGLGSALIIPGISLAEKENLPCYLETFTEKNLAFYKKHDFRIIDKKQVSKDGPHYWVMVRD
ncbi:acetyltransferase (GNAT) family protein [Bacillus oleivorans]|uniref:Acetyltransferase (GNAT) family protein n=1 Tax=Bacillus oleivorans TaxID=1448271 RepID=A0A285D7I5_9BACI|nr:GNAT family N-acetyltransferase [Bacillus oleivorans]SNX75774.1 acetyltransferase (GNAT) family protein [Bacillus oleivorans]